MDIETTGAIETPQAVAASATDVDGYEQNDLLAAEWQGSEPTVEETAVDAPEAVQEPQKEELVDEQTRVNRAMGAEKRRIEERTRKAMMQDPAFIVGQRMLGQIMQSHNTDANGAMRIFENNYYATLAEENGVSENVARAIWGRQHEEAHEPSMDDHAKSIRDEIAAADLPEGFDFDEAINDNRFATLLWRSRENPAELAAHVYHLEKKVAAASQEMADKIRARQAIPQPIKAAPTNTIPDYWAMSDEEFAETLK